MKEWKNGNIHYMDFNDLSEVIEFLERDRGEGGNSSRTNHATDSWDLGLGYEGAIACFVGGWAEGASKAYELADTVRPKPRGNRIKMRRAVSGMSPHIGAHLSGQPNSMLRPVKSRVAIAKPFVHLYLPIGFLAMIEADTAFNRGCAMVAIVDALELAGCRVKVTLVRSSEIGVNMNHKVVMRFMVKDYGDRLDMDQLIFMGAHPAMFRRIGFALQERSSDRMVWGHTNRGYGSSCDLPEEAIDRSDPREIVVALPRLKRNGGTPESFLREMIAALPEELGTELRSEME